jgi:adenine-specific DNA-methyltransferase
MGDSMRADGGTHPATDSGWLLELPTDPDDAAANRLSGSPQHEPDRHGRPRRKANRDGQGALELSSGIEPDSSAALTPADQPQSCSDAVMRCEDNMAFMRALPAASMKLIVTSPPYNIGKAYESRSPLGTYVDAQEKVIAECVRLLSPTGSLCWQVGNHVQKGEIFPLDMVLYPVLQKLGLKLRNRIVWHFEHGLHCSKRLSGRYETILWLTKGDEYTFDLDPIRVPSKYPGKKYFKGPKAGQLSCNPLGKNPGDVWIFPNVKSNHVEKTDHPCQFPVELVERLVLSLTEPGDAVFDPYMGVGSSVVAALKHGRRGYGCDVVPHYVDVAWERVRKLRAGVLQTRPMDRPVYDPAKPYGGHR